MSEGKGAMSEAEENKQKPELSDEKNAQSCVKIEEIPRSLVDNEERVLNQKIDLLLNTPPSLELLKALLHVVEDNLANALPRRPSTAPRARQSPPVPAPRRSLATPSCSQLGPSSELPVAVPSSRCPVPAPRKQSTLLNITINSDGPVIDLAKIPPRSGGDLTELGSCATLEFTLGENSNDWLKNQDFEWFDPLASFNKPKIYCESSDDMDSMIMQKKKPRNKVLRIRKAESNVCYIDLRSESDVMNNESDDNEIPDDNEVQSHCTVYELSDSVQRDIGILNKHGQLKPDIEENFNEMRAKISINIRSPLFRHPRNLDAEDDDDEDDGTPVKLSDILDAHEDDQPID